MNVYCVSNKQVLTKTLRRTRNFQFVILFLSLLLAAGSVYGGVTASISGTVTDATGAAVVGATVTATNVDTGIAATQQTNGQGFYSFQSLALGKYTIDVEQKGSKPTAKPGSCLM
jgi:hypothetical protein